jgi:hypothetical protein
MAPRRRFDDSFMHHIGAKTAVFRVIWPQSAACHTGGMPCGASAAAGSDKETVATGQGDRSGRPVRATGQGDR